MKRTASILLLALLAACGKSDNPRAKQGAESGPSPQALAEADQIFVSRCTPCHGSTGGGDGPASASLNPHPRNFHDKTWQASVNDEHIFKIIQYGGAAVGKSAPPTACTCT
jgi:mono/diheme cytochrome c family protein